MAVGTQTIHSSLFEWRLSEGVFVAERLGAPLGAAPGEGASDAERVGRGFSSADG